MQIGDGGSGSSTPSKSPRIDALLADDLPVAEIAHAIGVTAYIATIIRDDLERHCHRTREAGSGRNGRSHRLPQAHRWAPDCTWTATSNCSSARHAATAVARCLPSHLVASAEPGLPNPDLN